MKTKLNGKWTIVAIGCMRNAILHGETHDPLSVDETEHDLRLAWAIWCYGYSPELIEQVIRGELVRHTTGTPDKFLDAPGVIPKYQDLWQAEAWQQFQQIFKRISVQFAVIAQQIEAQKLADAKKARICARERKAAALRMKAIVVILSRRYSGMGIPSPSRRRSCSVTRGTTSRISRESFAA